MNATFSPSTTAARLHNVLTARIAEMTDKKQIKAAKFYRDMVCTRENVKKIADEVWLAFRQERTAQS